MSDETKVKILKQALEDIVNPIAYLKRKAEEEGGSLNGMVAIQLSKDSDFLKGFALRALEQIDKNNVDF